MVRFFFLEDSCQTLVSNSNIYLVIMYMFLPVLVHKLFLGNGESTEFVVQGLFILKTLQIRSLTSGGKNLASTTRYGSLSKKFQANLFYMYYKYKVRELTDRVLAGRVFVLCCDVLCPVTVAPFMWRRLYLTVNTTPTPTATQIQITVVTPNKGICH